MGCTTSAPRVEQPRSPGKSRRLAHRWLKPHKCQVCHSAVSCKSITVTNTSNYTASTTTANGSSEIEPLTGSPQTQTQTPSPPPSPPTPAKEQPVRAREPPAKERPTLSPLHELRLQRARISAPAGTLFGALTSPIPPPSPSPSPAPAPSSSSGAVTDPAHMTFSPAPENEDSDEEYPTSSVRDRAALFDQIDARSRGEVCVKKAQPRARPASEGAAAPAQPSSLRARIRCFEQNPNTQVVLTPDTKLFTFREGEA